MQTNRSTLDSAIRRAIVAIVAITTCSMFGAAAQAASRSMTGSLRVSNPSASGEGGTGVYGRKVGGAGPVTFPPTDGAKTVTVDGTTASTFVGRPVTLAGGLMALSGIVVQEFPAFAQVGQNSRSFMSANGLVTFAEDMGAVAACPGPGCTSSGAGSAISWCPPLAHNTTAPAPGTAGAPIGNWDCPSWQAGAGAGDRFMRIGVSNASGRSNFGGTFDLLRNFTQNVWRVFVQPSTPNASDAEVTRSFMSVDGLPWTPGGTNFGYQSTVANQGPRVNARLNANGAVQSTFGCTNGIGTPGGSFVRSEPQANLGNNCGTATAPNPILQGWGFKMTTGTISGSDPYPFGLVVTTVGGTPFNPNLGTQPASQGFFFSRMGVDEVSGTSRNLVLLGGGVAVDPGSGNAFFRIMNLEMNLTVPEPAMGLGLLGGIGALAAFARRRRS